MNSYKKNQYKQYLLEYLAKQHNIVIKNKNNKFNCPICQKVETAIVYPNNKTKLYCLSPECSFKGDIFAFIRKTKNEKMEDEKIADYLSYKLKIKVKEDINDLLKMYQDNGFCLFPIEPGTKNPKYGFKWTEKNYTNIKIWKDWVELGYGLGLRLGKEASKVIAIDIDSDKTYEEMKDKLGDDTLIQITSRGRHWLYTYEDEFNGVMHANLRNKGFDMEVRANNAYIVIAPTSVDGEVREWNNKPIQKMPKELKEFFLKLIDKKAETKTDTLQKAIDKNELGIKNGLTGLEGECNDMFIKLGGCLRKKLNVEQTEYSLSYFNKLLAKPMENKAMKSMFYQLRKYKTYDKEELAKELLNRLEVIKETTAFQLSKTLRLEQKDVEDVLKYLEDQGKIFDSGHGKWKNVNDVEWGVPEETANMPIDFEVPYFHDYNYFDYGEMVIIGGATARGKSHIVGNIIKKLAEQGLTTHLINTEPASKIYKITSKLGVSKDKILIPKKTIRHPMEIELVDNAITIIDWLKPKDGNFAEMENTYDHFRYQLEKHKGFLFIMTQLRSSNNDFFAPDLVAFYGSAIFKYCFGNEGKDPENTYFQSTKLRDSKVGLQYLQIPTYFDKETKTLELRK